MLKNYVRQGQGLLSWALDEKAQSDHAHVTFYRYHMKYRCKLRMPKCG